MGVHCYLWQCWIHTHKKKKNIWETSALDMSFVISNIKHLSEKLKSLLLLESQQELLRHSPKYSGIRINESNNHIKLLILCSLQSMGPKAGGKDPQVELGILVLQEYCIVSGGPHTEPSSHPDQHSVQDPEQSGTRITSRQQTRVCCSIICRVSLGLGAAECALSQKLY